ncbi:MAG: hypothetical protein WKF59_00005 [Chitinophagaceae bacterium]
MIPTNVFPANNALIIASSVACTVASNKASIWSLGRVITFCASVLLNAFLFAVEKDKNISPDPFPPIRSRTG